MAAVRRRRPPLVQYLVQSAGDRSSPISSIVTKDGWSVPKKTARRQLPPSTGSSLLSPGKEAGRGESARPESAAKVTREPGLQPLAASSALVSVPILLAQGNQADPRKCSSVPVGTVAQYQESAVGVIQSEIPKVDSMMSECDEAINFPKLGLEVCTSKDPISGPSKRARPVKPLSTRMPSRSSKAKGKASLIGRCGDQAAFTFAASSVAGRGSSAQLGPGAKKAQGRVGASSGTASESTLSTYLESCTHKSAVHQLKQAIRLSDSVVLMDSVQIVDFADTGSLDCLEVVPGDTEVLMESDQAVNCKGLGDLDRSVEMSGVMVGDLPNLASP